MCRVSGEGRHGRANLPFASRAALPASRPVGRYGPIPEAEGYHLGKVGRGPPPATWAVAGEFMAVPMKAGEGGKVDLFHRAMMVPEVGQPVTLTI
jgi:hypothetical protein